MMARPAQKKKKKKKRGLPFPPSMFCRIRAWVLEVVGPWLSVAPRTRGQEHCTARDVFLSSSPPHLIPQLQRSQVEEEEELMVPMIAGGGGAEETQVTRMRDMEAGRRVRKPYTITKSRESWTEPEHDKFLEALQLFDRDWRKIESFVGSKTVIQIRSHAQKYFLKVQKNGTGEHLPPPRPKRKAAHPYPHKASQRTSQVVLPQQGSRIMEQGCAIPMDVSTVATNSSANDAFPSWDNGPAQHFSPRHTQDATGSGVTNNCSSSIESQSGTWPTSEAIEQETILPALCAMPDFAQVYNFLGSVFDPETSGHLQRLREMDPIDAETVLLLMKNLSLNLSSPNFEAHRRLLSSYAPSKDQVKHESRGDLGCTHNLHLPFMVTSK